MPYTQEELQNYQWYQDRKEARKNEYNTYLDEVQQDQIDNETRNHIVDGNGTLLSFENIDDDVRLNEPFKRAGLDREDHNIVNPNQYPVYSTGEKFNLTIDTTIDELVNQPTSLPTIRLANQPQDNILEPRLFQNVDDDGTIVTPTLLTPSRKTPDERTNGYTIDLVNGDIIAPNGWNEVSVNTDEEKIDNYLQVYYLENNVRRQFPTQEILNSYVGLLLSSYIELEILVVEREDLDSIPLGSPMIYNAG
tara:strand:- start:269 stop:1018 length:750 start_codon:yes stop_codon:yes gene_type:complete